MSGTIEEHDESNGWALLSPEQVAERKKQLFTTDIIPSRPERQATIEARRQNFHDTLKYFDPDSQAVLRQAFSLGQELVIETSLPVFVEWATLITKAASALEAITKTLLCDNGPRTRIQLKNALGDLMGAVDELDTTVKEINGNPRSALWIMTDGLQLDMIRELRGRIKEFFSAGGTDQGLDDLREYLVQAELIDASQLFTISARTGKRGKPRDLVLDRIAEVVYELDQRRKPGQTNRELGQIAIAKLTAHEEFEAVARYEEQQKGEKRISFTARMIKRHAEKLGVTE